MRHALPKWPFGKLPSHQPLPPSCHVPTQLRVALWRVPTVVSNSEVETLVRNTISQYTHEERLDKLRAGLEMALAHFGAAPVGTNVVNIFVVPEYFFAYTQRLHFVDEHTKDLTVRGLLEISRLGNTVLFPGTLAWIKPFSKGNRFTKLFQSSRYDRAIDRIQKTTDLFAPPTEGKREEPTSVRKVREAKRGTTPGTVYYAQNTAWVMRGGEVLLKYHKRMNGGEIGEGDLEYMKANGDSVVWVPGKSTGSFTVEGINFGLEICAEHDGRALQMSLASGPVDVQVVISATMKVQPAKAGHVRDGGYLLHCDAVETPSAHVRHGGAYNLIAPGATGARAILPPEELARRVSAIREAAVARKKKDEDRDAMIADLQAYAGGVLHYYSLNL